MDDRTIRQLMSFGLTEYEARVYVALTLKSPQKASALALASGISRPHIYSTLKDLQEKGLVIEIPKKVVEYRALPATDAFYLLIEKRKRSIDELEEMSKDLAQRLENKDKALDLDGEKGSLMRAYQGHWNIINAMREMISKARTSCDFITNKPDDAHFAVRVFEREVAELKRRGLQLRVLMPINRDNLATLDNISSIAAVKHIDNLGHVKDLAISDMERSFDNQYLRVLIVDGSDAVFIKSHKNDSDEYAFVTRQKEIVDVTKLVYFNIWNSSHDFAFRKAEIENGVCPDAVKIVSGDEQFISTTQAIVSRASSSVYGILNQHQLIYNFASILIGTRALVPRGIKVKLIIDINSDISAAVKAIKEAGAEIRYYPGTKMLKALMSDTEAIVYIIDENVDQSDGSNLSFYTNKGESMSRLIGRFEREWAESIDADERINQLNGGGKR